MSPAWTGKSGVLQEIHVDEEILVVNLPGEQRLPLTVLPTDVRTIVHSGEAPHSTETQALDGVANRWQKAAQQQRDFSLRLMTSYICPQRCDYCHVFTEKDIQFDKPLKMAPELAIKALDTYHRLTQHNRNSHLLVSFYGGEPLINWETIQRALLHGNEIFASHNISWVLNTSATVLTPEKAQFLKENRVDVHLGIDGPSAATNLYRRFANGQSNHHRIEKVLSILGNCHYKLQFDSALTDANLHELDSLIDLAHDHGADRIYLAVTDHLLGKKDYHLDTVNVARKIAEADAYARTRGVQLIGPWKTALYSSGTNEGDFERLPYLVIDTTGLVHHAPYMNEPIGHLDEFHQEAFSQHYDAIMEQWSGDKGECQRCELLPSCNGYLMNIVMYHTGVREGFDRQCALAKNILDHTPIVHGGTNPFSAGARLRTSAFLHLEQAQSQSTWNHASSYLTRLTVYNRRNNLFPILQSCTTPVSPTELYNENPSPDYWPTVLELIEAQMLIPEEVDELQRTLDLQGKEKWQTDTFIFYYSPDNQEALAKHQQFLEVAHQRLSVSSLPVPENKILVYLASNRKELKRFWGNKPLPAWVTAFVTLGRVLVINVQTLVPEEKQSRYIRQLQHELGHICLESLNLDIPVWLVEGLCEYFAWPYDHQEFITKANANSIYSFRELEAIVQSDFLQLDRSPIRENMCYRQAHSFVHYLMQMRGERYLLDCLQSISSNKDFRTQFSNWYRRTLDSAEKRWRRTLGNGISHHKVRPAPDLQVVSNKQRAAFYNSKLGGYLVCNADLLRLFDFIQNGKTYAQIQSKYRIDDFDGLLSDLYHENLIVYEERNSDLSPAPEDLEGGSLVTNLRLNLTRGCNLGCTYCYVIHNIHDSTLMKWETAKQAIDEFVKLLRHHDHSHATVRFFGGEPLLNWKVVKRSLDYLSDVKGDIQVGYLINTNGTLLTEEIVRKLVLHQVEIIISLDGTEENHDQYRPFKSGEGSFARVANAIDLCLLHRARLSIDTTLGDHNYDNLLELIDYLIARQDSFGTPITLGLQSMAMGYQDEQDTTKLQQKVAKLVAAYRHASDRGLPTGGMAVFPYSRLFKKHPTGKYCDATGRELAVNPDGAVNPCSALNVDLGRVDSFAPIFGNRPYLELTQRGSGNIPFCDGCPIEVFCGGGCLADAAGSGTDIFKPTKNCRFERAFFEAMVREFLL